MHATCSKKPQLRLVVAQIDGAGAEERRGLTDASGAARIALLGGMPLPVEWISRIKKTVPNTCSVLAGPVPARLLLSNLEGRCPAGNAIVLCRLA